MALQKDISYKGLTIKDCYIKINSFTGNKDTMTYSVGLYLSSSENEPVFCDNFILDVNVVSADNLLTQGYTVLKAGEYAGATDV